MNPAIDQLEKWRLANGNVCYSIASPKTLYGGTRWGVTLYKYCTPRFYNEASKGGDTLEEAVNEAIKLWEDRNG